MEKVIRVGVMPGRIQEYSVETGTTIAEVLGLASLNPSGYDVKVDGTKITDLENTVITSGTSLVLLAKQVKGNTEKLVRVGVMPGRIQEYAIEVGTPISAVLQMADLNASGYDVKVDGAKVNDLDNTVVTSGTSLILLAKQVKGNK
jgi:sulfur carrier protein ThiS